MRKVLDQIRTSRFVEEFGKAIMQGGKKREEILLNELLEMYRDMLLKFSAKELNDIDSYRN